MPRPVIEALLGIHSLFLGLVVLIAGGLFLFGEPTLAVIVLLGGSLAALIWWRSRYHRMLVTIHRKWQSDQKAGPTRQRTSAKARDVRHEYYLATSQGQAIVTKSVYDRVDEGSAISVIGNVANGTIHVIWPLV